MALYTQLYSFNLQAVFLSKAVCLVPLNTAEGHSCASIVKMIIKMLFAAITFCRLSVQFPGFLYSRGSWKRQALNRDEGLGKYNTVICKRLVKRQRMSPLFVSPLLYCCLLSDCIFFSLSSCLSFLCILGYPAGCSLASGKSLLHSAGIFVPQPTYICTKKGYSSC